MSTVTCTCRPGIDRDNCPACEGTGNRIDFAAIRAANRAVVSEARNAALQAEAHANHLADVAHLFQEEAIRRSQSGGSGVDKEIDALRTRFAQRSDAAADASEVAADAWEEAGYPKEAEERRRRAANHRTNGFRTGHYYSRLSGDLYAVSDKEAGQLARASSAKLPKHGYVTSIHLGYAGPKADLYRVVLADLYRVVLTHAEKARGGRKRVWTWAVGNFH